MQRNEVTKKRRTGRRAGLAMSAAALASVLAISACGGSSNANTSSTSHTTATKSSQASGGVQAATAELKPYLAAPTKINITTPLKSAPPAGKTVVFLGTNNPNNVIVQKTAQQVADAAHWNYSVVQFDPANPGTLTQAITTAVAKHAQYLIETGTPMTSSQEKLISNAGAKLVMSSVYPVNTAPPVIGQSDSYAMDALMGKVLANYFVSNSDGKGDALMEHVPAYPILDGFMTGFQQQVKATCPACKLSTVNVTIPQLTAGQLPSVVVSALRSDSSANYLVFDFGPFADGITAALSSAGLSKIKIIGEGSDALGLAGLRNGSELAWTGFSSSYQALEAMDILFRASEGMPIPTAQEQIQPTQLLTKATVGNTVNFNAPTNALKQFEKLWHLG